MITVWYFYKYENLYLSSPALAGDLHYVVSDVIAII